MLKIENGKADKLEQEFFRVAIPIAKYYVTKRQPNFTYECMEAWGGNGFVEDQPMAKLFRQSPLNSIWEGSGNVIVLDVLRAGKSFPAFLKELGKSKGKDSIFDGFLTLIEKQVTILLKEDLLSSAAQIGARGLVDRLAIALQASLILEHGLPESARGYIESRVKPFVSTSDTGISSNYGSFVYEQDQAKKIVFDSFKQIGQFLQL